MLRISILTSVFFLAIVTSSGAASFRTVANYPGNGDGSTPFAPMIEVGGAVYGTTYYGGTYFDGTVYSLNPTTGATQTIKSFTGGADGAGPNGLAVLNGMIYGAAQFDNNNDGPQGYGNIFSLDPATGKATVIYQFTGGADGGGVSTLVAADNTLYGTTRSGGAASAGTIFAVDPATGEKRVVHDFGSKYDGASPAGNLTLSGGFLYGTTFSGGRHFAGTFYRFDLATGRESVLHSFSGSNAVPYGGPLVMSGQNFYTIATHGGAANMGAILALDPGTGATTDIYSFMQYQADPGLTLSGSLLYGATDGDADVGGTLYSFDPTTNVATTLYSLPESNGLEPDGDGIFAPLLSANGVLYGTTFGGGLADAGTAFAFTPSSKSFAVLHQFTGLGAGQYSNPDLIAVGATLYGTAPQGGADGVGSVFQLDPRTGVTTNLHDFTGGSDGYAPDAPLLSIGHDLYGVTNGMDAAVGTGTAFRIDRMSGAFTTVHKFGPNDPAGATPVSGLASFDGKLYGTTDPIDQPAGEVYAIRPAGNGRDQGVSMQNVGYDSFGGLVPYDGALYGTYTGLFGGGGVFKFDPAQFSVTTLHNFSQSEGEFPTAGLLVSGGMLYGTAVYGGTPDLGSVFRVDPASGALTTLHAFAGGTDGAYPHGALVQMGNAIYGTTTTGGSADQGTLYTIDLTTGSETVLYRFSGGADGGNPSSRLTVVRGSLFGTTDSGGGANRGTVFEFTP